MSLPSGARIGVYEIVAPLGDRLPQKSFRTIVAVALALVATQLLLSP